MGTFCLAMDNYFAAPKVIAALHEMNIGVLGTSRFRKAWPPKELQNIMQQEANFNDFFWCIDESGTLLWHWMDNAMAHHVFFEPLDSDSLSAFSTRSTILVPVAQNKKQGYISDLDNILATFPSRNKGPRELHARKRADQSFKDAYVYCSALYQQKKEDGSDILY
eukprot:15366076-Ditylum_brightwellii.AAC.1